MKKPELVMPAGSMKALQSAIESGADAVYLGAKRFSARMPAENFTEEDIAQAIAFCHSRGKKAYLALNTLIKDSELRDALLLAARAHKAGIDAIIVQDLGIMRALKDTLPGLRLHASTQMNCQNREAALLLAKLGVKRIVLARELSLSDIKDISSEMAKKDVETEVFVHGSMCFSYSGLCLFSSLVFNKSGNRGMCLQPCRMNYSLWKDGKKKKDGFLLSMKDLMGMGRLRELSGAGVSALKVEGRLKGADYAGSVAKAYRKAIDALCGGKGASVREMEAMRGSFLRECGEGYLSKGEKLSVESPAPRGMPAVMAIDTTENPPRFKVIGKISVGDELCKIEGERESIFKIKRIFVGAKKVETAKGSDALIEFSRRAAFKDGELLYFARVESSEDIPTLLRYKIGRTGAVDWERIDNYLDGIKGLENGLAKPKSAIILDAHAKGHEGKGYDETIVEAFTGISARRAREENKEVRIMSPAAVRQYELESFWKGANGAKLLCSDLGSLNLASESKSDFWVGSELNCFNSISAKVLNDLGAKRIVPSLESDLQELKENSYRGILAPMVFGYPRLMLSRAYEGNIEDGLYELRGRKGYKYKVIIRNGVFSLYNPVPINILDELPKFMGFGHLCIDLRSMQGAERENVLDKIARGHAPGGDRTRGHYKRSVE
jgi:collagenase-like PrtC family protease